VSKRSLTAKGTPSPGRSGLARKIPSRALRELEVEEADDEREAEQEHEDPEED
jgi:hypothetical protein